MASIQGLAEFRKEQWIDAHGSHEWDEHDLVREAEEELADCHNYLEAELKSSHDMGDSSLINKALTHVRAAFDTLKNLKRRRAADPTKPGSQVVLP